MYEHKYIYSRIQIANSMENKDLNRLKVILAEKKIKNKELAEMLGKDQATVSKWCTNSAQPSLENLVEIAKVLKIDVSELIRQKPQES